MCARGDGLTAEHASLTARTEHANTEHDTCTADICELEIAEAKCNGE